MQNLRHPALSDREVFWAPPGCLVVVTDLGRQTLRDLFEECRAEGLQGVPREPLLECLAAVADALDELNRREKLSHLGINPTQLLVEEGRVLLEDFGLTPLLWLPSGRPAAQLNPRYSAPELHEPAPSPTADQYSLALIYTEMLTGIYPRSKSLGGKSGAHRRPGLSEAGSGSGLHRRPNLPAASDRPGEPPGSRVDLDFLPAGDRPTVARALHDDPAQRFPSCTAFVQALQAATPPPVVSEAHAASLPAVVPFALLMGKAPPRPTPVPPIEQVATDLIAAAVGPVAVHQSDNARYIVHSDGAWEYRFPIRLFASLLRPKLEGFRQQWDARPVGADAEAFAFEIQTNSSRGGFWSGSRPRPAGLNVQLRFQPADAPDTNQREAVVRVGLFGDHSTHPATLLPSTAPRIFQSLRAYLQGDHGAADARALAVHCSASASTRCWPSWRSASRWRAAAATFRWAAYGSGRRRSRRASSPICTSTKPRRRRRWPCSAGSSASCPSTTAPMNSASSSWRTGRCDGVISPRPSEPRP